MDIEKLRRIPLFADLHDRTLERIAELSTEFEEPAGWVLVEVGRPGSGMFVLEEGTVEVQTPDGRSWELGVGEFFGSSRSSPMIRGRLASGRRRRCGASRSPGATSRNCSRRSLRSPWRCCRGSPSGSMLPTERA